MRDIVNPQLDAIKELKGIGDTTINKLISAGFNSLESIAFTSAKIIQETSGIGEKTAHKIIKESMQKLNVGVKTAEEVLTQRKRIIKIKTNSEELDSLLGGGIESRCLIEFFGEYRTGKTQLMHQLCVNVQRSRENGGLEGNALYIDTEGTFRPERIKEMGEAMNLEPNDVLRRVFLSKAYNSDHQILLIKEAGHLIQEHEIKLLIIDSLIGHFRAEYIGRGALADRQQKISQHIHDLQRLTEIFPELAIVYTNQVQSKPDVLFGNPIRATGGNVVAHGSSIRIFLRKGESVQRIAKVVDAPNLAEGEAIFSITEKGIGD